MNVVCFVAINRRERRIGRRIRVGEGICEREKPGRKGQVAWLGEQKRPTGIHQV
jgi:hypothetical protein